MCMCQFDPRKCFSRLICRCPSEETAPKKWNDYRSIDTPWISFPVMDEIRKTGMPPNWDDETDDCGYCFMNIQCEHSSDKEVEKGRFSSCCVDCLNRVVFREVFDEETGETNWGNYEFRKDCHKRVSANFHCCGQNARLKGKLLDTRKNYRFRVRYAASGYVPAMWSSVDDPWRLQMTR